ncbi:MAG: HalOD1 output domain-containing protein, partial [Haloferacaceae archaeon]
MEALEDDWLTREFDPERTAPSTALVEAIAAVEDVDPARLFGDAGLHECVDPDALDRLLTHDGPDTVTASLTVDGYPARIRSTGVVMVRYERR